MRNLGRPIIIWLLKILARAVVRKYQPRIIGITGSVGKTTTKDFTVAMLSQLYRVRGPAGNYNNELGVPLTILGQPTGTTAGHWWRVFRHGFSLLLKRHDYPEVLVLEMGADRPGDIGYLTSIAKPDIAVVTNVGNTHLEKYDSVESIANEKSRIVGNLKPDGIAVLNFDDSTVRVMQALAPERVLYFGFTDEAHIWIDQIERGKQGLTATLHLREKPDGPTRNWPIKTSLIGQHQLYALMAAFGVAYAADVTPEQALKTIDDLASPPGRLRVFAGKAGLTIIDDSYNASPSSMLAALDVLRDFSRPHRAILGDMRELGKASASGHRTVGEVAGKFLDELVVVGDEASIIAEAAKESGMDQGRIWFATESSQAAGLIGQSGHGGTVLVKGSHSMHLERAVKDLLQDPRDAKRLVS